MKFDLFEAYNLHGKRDFFTHDINCIPNSKQLQLMTQAGYKFKLDGKSITKKKIEEMLSNYKKGSTK